MCSSVDINTRTHIFISITQFIYNIGMHLESVTHKNSNNVNIQRTMFKKMYKKDETLFYQLYLYIYNETIRIHFLKRIYTF